MPKAEGVSPPFTHTPVWIDTLISDTKQQAKLIYNSSAEVAKVADALHLKCSVRLQRTYRFEPDLPHYYINALNSSIILWICISWAISSKSEINSCSKPCALHLLSACLIASTPSSSSPSPIRAMPTFIYDK